MSTASRETEQVRSHGCPASHAAAQPYQTFAGWRRSVPSIEQAARARDRRMVLTGILLSYSSPREAEPWRNTCCFAGSCVTSAEPCTMFS